MVPITASYAYQIPSGDMDMRFGPNSNIGLEAYLKTKRNFFIGAQGGFIFGNNVEEYGLLRNVLNSEGFVLDADGQASTILIYERGYHVSGILGKIIPVVGPNPNSGIIVKLGVGYLRHKIRIETQNNVVPQLEGDYLEGYDRLSAGPSISLAAGYQHIGNRRLINFQITFESMLAFAKPLRAFNFDTGYADTTTRFDMLNGIRLGWTLPIFKRMADDFYIY
ncbi:MAG: hypothetical protein IPI55_18670 [Flavobacteriales bacterium]|mgnify:CR=1 FL=1|nr:hypothetical protein [Flavobacteriales bacterium]